MVVLLATRTAVTAIVALGAFAAHLEAQVASVVETDPVPSDGDAADDAAIWVHPSDQSLSTVIGTDKDAGLAVYDLAGSELQFLPDGELNNVDVRYHFPLGGELVALVTAGERSQSLIAAYAVDPTTRLLQNVAAGQLPLGIEVYGSCMYRSPITGDTYFFGNSKNGEVEQWRLFDDGTGRVAAQLVRSFDVGGQVEGCVADDEKGVFFIGEENVGIWRYGAEPGDGTTRVQVDTTGSSGNLVADVEGLTIYYTTGGGGYLIASSQGNSTFVVYDRTPPHAALHVFDIAANAALGIDAVSGTDGIDVMNLGLGSTFGGGLFVAQDDSNSGAKQNFKLVPWEAIAASATPPLVVDAAYDVHGVKKAPGTPFCFGIGCPCGNDRPDAGCANSTGAGARLLANGSTSISADDLVLVASGCPPDNTGLFYMGDTIAVPVLTGDGIACTGLSWRFVPAVVDAAGDFVLSAPASSAVNGSIVPGATRHFQAWTRDVLCGPPPAACQTPCGSGSNLTNGYSVTFTP